MALFLGAQVPRVCSTLVPHKASRPGRTVDSTELTILVAWVRGERYVSQNGVSQREDLRLCHVRCFLSLCTSLGKGIK
jgi:hypothetical protein